MHIKLVLEKIWNNSGAEFQAEIASKSLSFHSHFAYAQWFSQVVLIVCKVAFDTINFETTVWLKPLLVIHSMST